MPKNKNVNIKYTSREFQSIKEDLIDHAKRYYPDTYRDFSKPSFGSMVLDSVSYVGDVLSYYLDYQVNESFLDTAIEFDNVRKHARALGYNYTGIPSTYGILDFYILCPSNAEGTAPDLSYLPVLKAGSSFTSQNGGNFILTEDVIFNQTNNEFRAARFNAGTGGTTYFAIRASGQVESGLLLASEANLNGLAFERFRRVRVGGPEVTGIISVVDSEGNKYYEVDNLAQETILVETTNPTALTDGVRSVIKPFVAVRRFTVERDDTGTYLQFGFGSEDDDPTGLTDPSKVALKMHGKNNISLSSFDPTQLIKTDKLGISPYNTTLNIVYKSNSPGTINAGANTITVVQDAKMNFTNIGSLDSSLVSSVRSSLECANPEPVTSVIDSSVTVQEIKQRAKASFAAQSRAVTKQDYESLVYNMPPKFGAVKRANVVNDPSSTNRRLSLYVISEDNNGILQSPGSVVKNNIKNWISSYKSLNDVIDIHDAIVVNFQVDFLALSDKRYDNTQVLFSCIQAIKEYFSEVMYIGEPLYITRIYEILNRIEGVIDVKNVKINNVLGGVYSNASLNMKSILSKDGTYYKVPKNVILELRFPSLDIKGTVK
jgi:phage-related baseplate assembly protein